MKVVELWSKATIKSFFGSQAAELLEQFSGILMRHDGRAYGLVRTEMEKPPNILVFSIEDRIIELWVQSGKRQLFESEQGPQALGAKEFLIWLLSEKPSTGLNYEEWVFDTIRKAFSKA